MRFQSLPCLQSDKSHYALDKCVHHEVSQWINSAKRKLINTVTNSKSKAKKNNAGKR
ncbi:hypothetical protein CKO_00444 [Citrobacter koseri ATCC BAA-895]|uniref:Uncharacterized protein n=1 Tax=Citrobacter koseri (strain ATCC BAA-895 / CDC 4225-83 / SGSC4696) TaxID=290338 RepID=A8ADN7_CITK8|nr:hypothetical protein CKO_00444 [Citrobacter koseri ATCC BAA-895]